LKFGFDFNEEQAASACKENFIVMLDKEPSPISIHSAYALKAVEMYCAKDCIPEKEQLSPNPWKIATGYE